MPGIRWRGRDRPRARNDGRIRAALFDASTPIGNNDLWIAAQALPANLILVTNN